MRSTLRLTALVACAAALGCGTAIDVRTMASPDASFSSLHTFRMLPPAARRDGLPATGQDDPMLANSIANRALREQIIKTFEERGYILTEGRADFVVAFYATSREKLELGNWDYGYPATNPGAPPYPRQAPPPVSYVEGSVVVDALTPVTRELLWRGEGRAALTDDATENLKQLVKTAAHVVAKFPAATPRVVANH